MRQSGREGDGGEWERIGETLGGMVGRTAGKATDMAMDVAGSLFGEGLKALGGWWSGGDAEQAARSFGEDRDRACRRHYETSAPGGAPRAYEDVRPLYQFGHVAGQNPDYQGRTFEEVEPELQRAWSNRPAREHGDWPEVRGFVGFGYARGASGEGAP